MKLSTLSDLLSEKISASDYSAAIAADLAEHTRGLETLGGIAIVRATEDNDLVLDRAGLSLLCRLFVNGQLTAAELAYTADILELSERVEFATADIANDLAECTDPEINGPLTVARAQEIASIEAAV